MNRTAKMILTVGIACCLLGGIFYGIGKYSGGGNYVKETDMDSFDGKTRRNIIELDKEKMEEFQKIKVDFENFDLVIKSSGDDSCYLSYRLIEKKNENPLSYGVEGDTLRLKEERGGASYYIHVDLNFLTQNADGEGNDIDVVTLYVPGEKTFEDCRFEIRDGDMQIETLKSKNMDILLNSGDLSCRDMEFSKMLVEMEDGDFEAREITVSGEAEIENRSGDVDIRFAGESGGRTEITARTESGDMEAASSLKGVKKSDDYGDFCEYKKKVKEAAGRLRIQCYDGDISLR